LKIDKSKFLAAFLEEANAHVAALNRGLVAIENEPRNSALVDEVFRSAHTLKGAARMMGFQKITELAHGIEDRFAALKGGEARLERSVADSVFADLDKIASELKVLAGGGVTDSALEDAFSEEGGARSSDGTAERGPSSREAPLAKDSGPGGGSALDGFIRVPIDRINHLLNLIGEIVINKVKSTYKLGALKKISGQAYAIERMLGEMDASLRESAVGGGKHEEERLTAHSRQTQNAFSEFRGQLLKLYDEMQNEIFHLNPVIQELQQKMKEMRMLPCETLFEGFHRLVRDIAHQEGKDVELLLDGGETELDKKVLDAIKGPLIHVLRNAVDHGIEPREERIRSGKPGQGRVSVSARQEAGKVFILVSDDGRGMRPDEILAVALKKKLVTPEEARSMEEKEILNLVFAPGFSTAPIITDISGRGVGLDAVRTELERVKGAVDIETKAGTGTTMKFELPLTVAILQVLLIEAGGRNWALPLRNLESNVKIPSRQVSTIERRMIAEVRGRTVPLIDLAGLLGVPKNALADPREEVPENLAAVLVNAFGKRVGFIIDRVLGEEEVFLKNIGNHLGTVAGVNGAAILADGAPVVVLNVADLIRQAEFAQRHVEKADVESGARRKKILVVEDSLTTRELEKSILEANGYDVETAVDGLDAMNKLTKERFDLVVSDVEMPRMDGFELCRRIRETSGIEETPVIFVTSLTNEEEMRKGIEVGAQAYIVKRQFNQGELVDTIERLV
jgi:two-component system chemotaxis sensor kinase CheA